MKFLSQLAMQHLKQVAEQIALITFPLHLVTQRKMAKLQKKLNNLLTFAALWYHKQLVSTATHTALLLSALQIKL